ncbi:MAG: family 20 glycosylhydrolase, partial [Bacteroidota bacterium]
LVTDAAIPAENYTMKVTDNAVVINAGDTNGFLYGLETVRQLLPAQIERASTVADMDWSIPRMRLRDGPRYAWRGLMLDVSRHFFPKEYILRTIDRLAFLKMNTLHLHLVDDQGWRIEIKKYPELTKKGAYRVNQENRHWNNRETPKPGDKATYGGFYSQEEIREIVAYAASRGITVVPEIEMPAHVMSAIAAYPELSCTEEPIAVPSGGVWPITEIYCVGKESTFTFLENVLVEVMELFPSKYIHVGGDEATKTNWENCPHSQKRMRDEGLASVEELQSYFIKRIERFLSGHGRILVGWDEILEGGLAPGATVMSWRGVKGGWEASMEGHDVVMSPGTHCYFDHYQGPQDQEPLAIGGYTPLSKVYEFDPVVDSMSQKQKGHVLGGQANLWSEYIPTVSHSEYMLYPRLAALSEALWTPEGKKDWPRFAENIQHMFSRFELLGINYAQSAYSVSTKAQANEGTSQVSLVLQSEFPDVQIRYLKGPGDLQTEGVLYEAPIQIDTTLTITAGVFQDGMEKGKRFQDAFTYHEGVGKQVTFAEKYHENYQGSGNGTLTNVLRGTTNFHDGQWLAWLNTDMEAVVDLGAPQKISKVALGTMENRGPGIYFPSWVKVWISNNNRDFKEVGAVKGPREMTSGPALREISTTFEEQEARFIKIVGKNPAPSDKAGGAWLFVDEIMVE